MFEVFVFHFQQKLENEIQSLKQQGKTGMDTS